MTDNTQTWSDTQTYLPYYLGFARWCLYIIIKFIPCIFYKFYTKKFINNEKKKNEELFEEYEYTYNDVTVLIPVYHTPKSFKENIISIAKNNPFQIIIIADKTCYIEVLHKVDEIEGNIKVISESKPGKREAMVTGLKRVTTRLCCFIDDDCQVNDLFLYNLVIPFNYKNIGGVGVMQITRSADPDRSMNLYEIMADFRLAARYIEVKATTTVEKSCSCISGRTACYKTELIQTEEFYDKFLNEYFFGMKMLSGDDKFITRFILNKGHKTYHQLSLNCHLTTTFESGSKHWLQVVRWSRNTYRSDITLLFVERKSWRQNPFLSIILLDKLFSPLYMIYGLIIIPTFSILNENYVIFIGWICWLLVSRGLKVIHHFYRKPKDLIYLPIYIMYQYILMLIKIYAIFTLNNRNWGSRAVKMDANNEVLRTGEHKDVEANETDYDGDIENSNSDLSTNNIENKKNKWNSSKIYPTKILKKSAKI
jgi:cellulose synthase/poly-beta-1,6-N-acetylglucosamine synthase-like glycosyltransferase